MVFQAEASDQPAGSTTEAGKDDVPNYRWKPGKDGKTIYFADSEHGDWGWNFIPGDCQLPSRPATDIRLTVVVQNPRISPDHFLSLAIKVGPVLEAHCDTEFKGSEPLVPMASVIYKHPNHACLFGETMARQGYEVVIGTANMVGKPNGLQCGSTERLKSETVEMPEPQFKFPSISGSATIDRSLHQILRKVHARLRERFPLMPGFLFQRAFRRHARLANELFRFKVEHAQHATLGPCPSGKHCSHRGTISSFSTNVLEPPAQDLPAIVECPVCFKMKLFQTRTDWIDHLYTDIKPYFCTAFPCPKITQFSRKYNWLRHEEERCQKQYWRCDVHGCTTMWVNQTDFKTHLVEEHILPEDDELDAIQQRCGHDYHRRKKTCSFCGLRGHDNLDTHLGQHMVEISEYVLQVVKQQELTPQPIIDPIEQGEANQSHPPTFSKYDMAGTVPDETVPLQQPFESAQSTAVNYEECLSTPFTTKCEQPDESLLPQLGGSSNQHLQSQGAHYGGTIAPMSLPGSAPLSWYDSSMVFRHPGNSLYGAGNTWDFNAPSLYHF